MDAKVKLIKIIDETHDVKTFVFEKPDNFDYMPGQFIMLNIDEDENKKAFSLSSSPTENFLSISIKMTGSEFKEKLTKHLDKYVTVSEPFGRFVFEQCSRQKSDGRQSRHSHVMITGGIGITPFRGMIKFATDKGIGDEIILLYSNKTPEDIAFFHELEELQKKNRHLKVVHTITRDSTAGYRTGRIDESTIREEVNNIESGTFYVCGPPAMVDAMVAMLRSMGIKNENIKLERFVGY